MCICCAIVYCTVLCVFISVCVSGGVASNCGYTHQNWSYCIFII